MISVPLIQSILIVAQTIATIRLCCKISKLKKSNASLRSKLVSYRNHDMVYRPGPGDRFYKPNKDKNKCQFLSLVYWLLPFHFIWVIGISMISDVNQILHIKYFIFGVKHPMHHSQNIYPSTIQYTQITSQLRLVLIFNMSYNTYYWTYQVNSLIINDLEYKLRIKATLNLDCFLTGNSSLNLNHGFF